MPILNRLMMPDLDARSPLRALHSLREKHVTVLARTMSQLPGSWSLECHESYDGDLTLMLMPQQQGRANLVVNRGSDGFHLIANQDDDYCELGCFGALDDLLATVRANVGPTSKAAVLSRA